jgi:hypothetical protein
VLAVVVWLEVTVGVVAPVLVLVVVLLVVVVVEVEVVFVVVVLFELVEVGAEGITFWLSN